MALTDLDGLLAPPEPPPDAAAWLDAGGLPPLDGPARDAELLVAVAHRSADWDVWGGARALRYWDALASRVRSACYAGPLLSRWQARLWSSMSLAGPYRDSDRRLLASLLSQGGDREVLAVLRREAPSLVLRVRVAADAARQRREQGHETGEEEGEADGQPQG